MSDDKPKPVDDLKEGLNLLFRAAKGAVERLPTDKLEGAAKGAAKEVGRAIDKLPGDAKDAVKEVGRAFETIGTELEKVVDKVIGSSPPPAPHQPGPQQPPPAEAKQDEPPAEPPRYDDAYAPEPPPKGPRVG